MYHALVVLLVNVTGGQPVCTPKANPTKLLECAENLLQYGDCESAIKLLRPAIERGVRWSTKADEVEALRIFGVCLSMTGRKQAARLIFERAVKLDPTLHLDPRLVPPDVVQDFRMVRRRILAQRLERISRPRKTLWLWNLLPPGGQIQNRQYLKAGLVAGAELLFLGLNLTSYFLLESPKYRRDGSFVVQDSSGKIVEDHRSFAKAMMAINYASFALLLGTIVYGIVDGFVVMRSQARARARRIEFLKQQLAGTPKGPWLTWRF